MYAEKKVTFYNSVDFDNFAEIILAKDKVLGYNFVLKLARSRMDLLKVQANKLHTTIAMPSFFFLFYIL